MQIAYVLRRSARRKTIQITIEPISAKIIVRAPQRTSLDKINKFVLSKKEWILKKQNQILSENVKLPTIESGEIIFIAGKKYLLNLGDISKPSVNDFVINLPQTAKKEGLLLVTRTLMLTYAIERTSILARRYGLKYRSVGIGTAKTQWGSCSTDNDIVYSVALAFLPEDLIEFVMVHELCHSVVKNHGKNFYNLLGSCLPNHRKSKQELKKYVPYLHFLT